MPMLDVEGGSLYYQVKGEGTPIIFIHPPLLTSTNFLYQLEHLSKTYKVITFDIRGHGRSVYSKQAITYPLIVNDIVNLLDYLGVEKAFICGYSTGGSILLEFLLMYPNRALGGIVISGMSEVKDLFLKQRISLGVKLSNKKTISVLTLAISLGNSKTRQVFRKLYEDASFGDARNIQQYYRFSLHYNCTSRLQDINSPVLLVFGTKDKVFHQYAYILHGKLPHNELVFLKEKHQIPTKAAIKLNEKIDEFIQKHSVINSLQ
ncbi:alpha/beta fold hydrolase [Lysinibacillus pakistanensis]|uniref:Alpha/beta hydrolase n=1 Tax=Lysinibacillus pakistanensis TaxID=759811 RepID=A0AAX3WRC4_9BACI|nr:alpha/beta hydrolase [Lysinibacillus pakistanensis]WHY44490.1 alpha/beta hydrolase [Lysinibacillus pakistanensis]WHY49498.1 alpha/beta hydrolase [Lysinibacillus pakistanensis]